MKGRLDKTQKQIALKFWNQSESEQLFLVQFSVGMDA